MRRALVTGATGFVGRCLVALLRAQGWCVGQVVSSRSGSAAEPQRFHLEHGEASEFETIFGRFSPDVVFHMAGRTRAANTADLYASNVLLAANLLEAVRRCSSQPVVVLAGSAAEYGFVPPDALPVSEDHPCQPTNDYGISKFAQTLTGLARAEAGLPVIIARIFNPIGPGMPEHLALGSFAAQLRRAKGGCDLYVGNLDIERDFIDVAEATRLIATLGTIPEARGKVFNICSGKAFQLRSLVEELVRASGRSARIIGDPARMRSNEMHRMVGSTARLESLGLYPNPPDFGVLLPRMLSDASLQSDS